MKYYHNIQYCYQYLYINLLYILLTVYSLITINGLNISTLTR